MREIQRALIANTGSVDNPFGLVVDEAQGRMTVARRDEAESMSGRWVDLPPVSAQNCDEGTITLPEAPHLGPAARRRLMRQAARQALDVWGDAIAEMIDP